MSFPLSPAPANRTPLASIVAQDNNANSAAITALNDFVGGAVHSVLKAGVAGDDTVETTEIQAALTAAADGDVLVFDSGRYRIDAQVSWTGKRLGLVFMPGAVLVEDSVLTVPMLLGDGVDGSVISGLRVEGAEDAASFDGLDSDRVGLRLANTDGATVEQIVVSGKSWGVHLDTCTGCTADGVNVEGMRTDPVDHTGPGGWNYHSAVLVTAGAGNTVKGIVTDQTGSALLAMASTQRLTVDGVQATRCQDNGVYISSGDDCSIANVTGYEIGGSAAKARGERNTIIGCKAVDVGSGFVLSPYDETLTDGYSGGFGVIQGCTVDGAWLMGIDIAPHPTNGAVLPQACSVIGNTIRNAGESGGVGSDCSGIRTQGDRHTIDDNQVDGAQFGIFALGNDEGSASLNRCRNIAQDGIRADGPTGAVIVGNRFSAVTGNGADLRNSVDCIAAFNTADAGIVVRAITANTNTRLREWANVGALDVSEGVRQGFAPRLDDGTGALPALSFASDANTGLYRLGEDDLGLTVGGAFRLRVLTTEVRLRDGTPLRFGSPSGPTDRAGTGTPEGAVSASVGSTYRRTDGGDDTTLYVKTSGTGNTGWRAVTTAAP